MNQPDYVVRMTARDYDLLMVMAFGHIKTRGRPSTGVTSQMTSLQVIGRIPHGEPFPSEEDPPIPQDMAIEPSEIMTQSTIDQFIGSIFEVRDQNGLTFAPQDAVLHRKARLTKLTNRL